MQGSTNSIEQLTKEQHENFGAWLMARVDDYFHHILQQLSNLLQWNQARSDLQNLFP